MKSAIELRAENAALQNERDELAVALRSSSYVRLEQERDELRERVRELVIHVQTLEEALKGD